MSDITVNLEMVRMVVREVTQEAGGRPFVYTGGKLSVLCRIFGETLIRGMVEDVSRNIDFKVAAAAAEELYTQLAKTERILGIGIVLNAQGRHEIRLRLKHSPTVPIVSTLNGVPVVVEAPALGPPKQMNVIEAATCSHCDGLILEPQTDKCSCGGELHPISRNIPLGVATSKLRFR